MFKDVFLSMCWQGMFENISAKIIYAKIHIYKYLCFYHAITVIHKLQQNYVVYQVCLFFEWLTGT